MRSVTFFYTTGARLLRASDLSELSVPLSAERREMLRMLRERREGGGAV